jgi:pSer/pThr/pTyr-binding forkhead associated (FHA) protein
MSPTLGNAKEIDHPVLSLGMALSIIPAFIIMTDFYQQQHILVIEDDAGQRSVILESPVYAIGRDSKCDIRLVSQFVSRRHATLVQLSREDGTTYYRMTDGTLRGKKSANGLLINGQKLQTRDLQGQDEIIFGPGVRATYHLRGYSIVKLTETEALKSTVVDTIP